MPTVTAITTALSTQLDLLLMSSSREGNSAYLEHGLVWIAEQLTGRELLFVPFAGVTIDWDAYLEKVRDALAPIGVRVHGLHQARDAQIAVQQAEAIAVGGGNTFHLLKTLYDWNLLKPLRERVLAGMPYLGWSAGSNIAAPTICTTNDMPIVQPAAFTALDLLPFQINPHYQDWTPPDFHGETRAMRLQEFLTANRTRTVLALREGSALRVQDSHYQLLGPHKALGFRYGAEILELDSPALAALHWAS